MEEFLKRMGKAVGALSDILDTPLTLDQFDYLERSNCKHEQIRAWRNLLLQMRENLLAGEWPNDAR